MVPRMEKMDFFHHFHFLPGIFIYFFLSTFRRRIQFHIFTDRVQYSLEILKNLRYEVHIPVKKIWGNVLHQVSSGTIFFTAFTFFLQYLFTFSLPHFRRIQLHIAFFQNMTSIFVENSYIRI